MADAVLVAVEFHSRIFLILVATIYAGELVWRDRDARTAELRDALPVRLGAMVTGRILGILFAEAVLAGALAIAALLVQALVLRSSPAPWLTVRSIFGVVYPGVVEVTLLSLFVHAVVQHKVAGHVLLIGGWVAAAALATAGPSHPLLRFGISTGAGGAPPGQLASPGPLQLYGLAVAAACAVGAWLFWVRGAPSPLGARLVVAGARLRRGGWLAVLTAALIAAWAAQAVR